MNHFAIIDLRRTDGANYGVYTKDIVSRLKEWESRLQLEIFGAGNSWVAVQFHTLPENICAFAEEIYQFCPDSVEQGVGLLNESDDPELFEAARQLCPDLSDEMQQMLSDKMAKYGELDIPAELRAMLDAGAGFNTPTDMGIRLLAHNLHETRQLFLWWD